MESIVIALMMYLNDPPVLKEHLLMPDYKTCLSKKKRIWQEILMLTIEQQSKGNS